MSYKNSASGSYTGNVTSRRIHCGFRPAYMVIWNDTDNDVIFHYLEGMADASAIRINNAGTFTPAALSLSSNATFSGTAPYTAETYTVTDDDAPGGNQVYVKFLSDGSPYLCSNLATLTADTTIAFSGSQTLVIKHDANAAVGGIALTVTDGGALEFNNATYQCNVLLKCFQGGLLSVAHNGAPAGANVYYDDGGDNRLEATFGDNASHAITLSAQGWQTQTPAGTISGACTGNSAGSVSGAITETTSNGITIQHNGFTVGSDSVLNESGKTFRYLCLR